MSQLDLDALKKEARRKNTSYERLRELAGMDEALSRMIAKSKKTPPKLLEELARSGDMPTRRAVAANENTDVAVLEQLAGDQQWTVLKSLARNPNTPDKVLLQLAKHKQYTVREALVMRGVDGLNMPRNLVDTLVQDDHEKVRFSLIWYAQYLPLQHKDYEVLATQSSVENRRYLMVNASPYCVTWPTSLWEQVMKDEDDVVREHVVRRGGGDAGLFKDDDYLDHFANDDAQSVRAAVGYYLKDRPDLTQKFLNDPCADVKLSICRHADVEMWQQLANDPDPAVRAGLAQYHAAQNVHKLTLDDWLKLARDEDVSVRLGFTDAYEILPEIASVLVSDESEEVRLALAKSNNSSLPKDVVIQLAREGNVDIRHAVLQHQ
ncbi:MAG: hypothetical protein AAF267_22455, partial [Deinococcota bacterium]